MWNESGYASLVLPVLFVLPAWYLYRNRSKSVLPYPPGPRGYPLIGNIFDFPADVPLWEGLAKMAEQQGIIFSSVRVPR
jgi:hypothetical protein